MPDKEHLDEPEATVKAEAPDDVKSTTDIEDSETEKAVDEIANNESDTVLAVEDAKTDREARSVVPKSSSWKDKVRSVLKNKKTWLVVAVVAIIIFALPMTRYTILGLFIKKSVHVQVIDSKNSTPVSNAEVQLGGGTAKTDANGNATVKASLGQSNLVVSKQYYETNTSKYLVGFKSTDIGTTLVATGRLVPITVTNKVTGKVLAGAQISILGTTAKTNSKGVALVALPANKNIEAAKLSAPGYNTAKVNVVVTDKTVPANSFSITPAGQIYFLSNLSGNLDVVKSNLDGTDRHTVLAGTGHEDKPNTSLLASRDWRYLVLKSRREGSTPSLYLIDASNDKVTQFENSDANSNLVGWYGHNFVFDLTKNNQNFWQDGRQALKSYDADHMQLNQLDQNQAEGDQTSYAYQTFTNYYLVNGVVAYNTQWVSAPTYNLNGKNDTIRAVQSNGQGKKDYQNFPSGTVGYIGAVLYEPQAVYYSVPNKSYTSTAYYSYENQEVKTATDVDQSTFTQAYPTYLLSPSGNQTFWTDLRDGKNTLFIGDAQAKNGKQIATLSAYSPYGWFSDNYTLVSKNSSELYIMPVTVLKPGQQPVKITDYYKPAQTFNGYGYGYGGL